MDLEQVITEQYPQFAYMLQDPELRYLLFASLDPSTGFDSATFQNHLMQTNWWKTHSASARNWTQQVALDPASAERTMSQKIDTLRNLSMSGGLNLSEAQLRWEASLALQNGWSDQEVKRNLLMVGAQSGQNGLYSGEIGGAAQQVRQMAADMALPISEQNVNTYANDLWMGQQTADEIKTNLAQQAIHAYGMQNPELANALNRGQTVAQFMDPQIQAVASNLEIGTDQINLAQPKWQALMNYSDPNQKGVPRVMTVGEAQQWARSQDEFKNTSGGRQLASDMVLSLAQTFGTRK